MNEDKQMGFTVATLAALPVLIQIERRATLDLEAPAWQLARGKVERQVGSDWFERILAGDVIVRAMHHGPTYRKEMALTFDDGPHGEVTRELLEVLAENDVKATFFVVGKMVKDRKVLTKEIADAGHEIANHSFSHPDLSELSLEDLLTEYKATNLMVEQATGVVPRYCRPPGGQMNDKVLKAASALGLSTVYWNNNPGDYKFEDPDQILIRLRLKRDNGSIILLHSGLQATVDALRRFIPESKAMGYRFVLVGDWDRPRTKVSRPAGGRSAGEPVPPVEDEVKELDSVLDELALS